MTVITVICWCCRRNKLLFTFGKALCLTFFICACTLIVYIQVRVNLVEDEFVELSKCPACYGRDMCAAFQERQITLDQWPIWNRVYNAKNVYYGQLRNEKVVLKKLASEWELQQFDAFICSLNNAVTDKTSRSGCDVGKTLLQTAAIIRQSPNPITYLENILKTGKIVLSKQGIISDAIGCSSQRFLTMVLNTSQSETSTEQLLTTILLNPEPVLIKSFKLMSSSFPRIMGACGRVIIEENVGPTLAEFLSSPLFIRLEIAKQLLKIAYEMTFNAPGGFRYYMTDVSFENFAIKQKDNTLRVVLVDVESILVVDPQVLATSSPKMSTYTNPFGGRNGHLQFSTIDLCHHPLADHNYYAICECLLSDVSCTSGTPGGLLWGISQKIERKWHIRSLIQDCQYGSGDRIQVAHKLMKRIDEVQQWLSAKENNHV